MSDTNTSSSAPVKKNITRRDVLAMAGCGVAGLVVGGVLATAPLATARVLASSPSSTASSAPTRSA